MSDTTMKIMISEAIVKQIMASTPQLEIDIAEKIKVATANRVIKKVLNDKDLNAQVYQLIQPLAQKLTKDAGIILQEKQWPSSIKLSPDFEQKYLEVLKAKIAKDVQVIAEAEVASAIQKLPSLVPAIIQDTVFSLVRDQLRHADSRLSTVLSDAINAAVKTKLGL